MLIQPQAELILDDAGHECGGLSRRQTLLGLTGELRLLHLGREHVAHAIPHIFRRELQSLRQKIAEFAELADRIGETQAQAIHVRAALRRRNQIDVALLDASTVVDAPGNRPLRAFLFALDAAAEHLGRQKLGLAERFAQILVHAAGVEPFLSLARLLDEERHLQARAQHGFRLENVLQPRNRERHGFEKLRIGPEAHRRTGVVLAYVSHDLQLRTDFAVLERDVVFLAAALDPALEVLRQRVHDRHADAVQAAGELVVLIGELTARMQARENQLDAAHLLLRMDVDRHAASIVGHRERAILVDSHVDALGMTGQRFVDGVVDDFVSQMIGPTRLRVHAGTSAYGIEAAENFDIRSGVRLSHRLRGRL